MLILLSGGLDSAANLAFAHTHGVATRALHIQYGQRAEAAELAACQQLCAYYQVPLDVIDCRWFAQLPQGGALLTEAPLPDLARHELDSLERGRESAKAVWVPNRNGVFLAVASAVAEAHQISTVLVGFNTEEAQTFPDNSESFLRATNLGLHFSTQGKVKIDSYTVLFNKKEIVQRLRALPQPFPFTQVWSCYTAGPTPCGRCESCQRFSRATENEKSVLQS